MTLPPTLKKLDFDALLKDLREQAAADQEAWEAQKRGLAEQEEATVQFRIKAGEKEDAVRAEFAAKARRCNLPLTPRAPMTAEQKAAHAALEQEREEEENTIVGLLNSISSGPHAAVVAPAYPEEGESMNLYILARNVAKALESAGLIKEAQQLRQGVYDACAQGAGEFQLDKANTDMVQYENNYAGRRVQPDAHCMMILDSAYKSYGSAGWEFDEAAAIQPGVLDLIRDVHLSYVRGVALSPQNATFFAASGAGRIKTILFAQRLAPMVQELQSGQLRYDGTVDEKNLAWQLLKHDLLWLQDPSNVDQHFWLDRSGTFSLRMHRSKGGFALTVAILDRERPVFPSGTPPPAGGVHPDLFKKGPDSLEKFKITFVEAGALIIPASHKHTTWRVTTAALATQNQLMDAAHYDMQSYAVAMPAAAVMLSAASKKRALDAAAASEEQQGKEKKAKQ